MTLILTGSPTRFGEDHFTEDNGLLEEVRAALRAKLQTETEAAAGTGAAQTAAAGTDAAQAGLAGDPGGIDV